MPLAELATIFHAFYRAADELCVAYSSIARQNGAMVNKYCTYYAPVHFSFDKLFVEYEYGWLLSVGRTL